MPLYTDYLRLTGDAQVVEFTGILVVSIERDDAILTPQGESTVEAGDVVTILSRHGIDDDLETAFSHAEAGAN